MSTLLGPELLVFGLAACFCLAGVVRRLSATAKRNRTDEEEGKEIGASEGI